jgi:hypothetical protein
LVKTGDQRSTPKVYRTPTLTAYGSVRDLTRGSGIGKPDNGVSGSHSMIKPGGGAS